MTAPVVRIVIQTEMLGIPTTSDAARKLNIDFLTNLKIFKIFRKVVNDCSSDDWVDDQDALFICCDPCTGNICGTSIWACEQDAENSLACQNRNKMRFLKTIQL